MEGLVNHEARERIDGITLEVGVSVAGVLVDDALFLLPGIMPVITICSAIGDHIRTVLEVHFMYEE